MIIDCDTCSVRDIACGDCVVSVLIGAPSQNAPIGTEEARVIDLLASRGMVPPLRFAAEEVGSEGSQPVKRRSV